VVSLTANGHPFSISNDPENVTAMTALVAMGVLDSDDSLVDAALSEIQSLTLDKRAELDPGRIVPGLLIQHHLALVCSMLAPESIS
jgi:superkiller protein 3